MTGDDLRARRAALNLNQTALAEAIGARAQADISRWERMKLIPEPRALWLDTKLRELEAQHQEARP
jgi:transcriptional regulator with XRE-family HTH domain